VVVVLLLVKVDQEVQEQLQVLAQLQQLMLAVAVVVEMHHLIQVKLQEMVEPVVVEMVEIDHQLDLQE
jgi:uncharacterized membrane protein YqgA involved in biofilm formation